MKRFTWRRVCALRAFGRRHRRASRLLGMLLAALSVPPWFAAGAHAQTTVAAGATETNATIDNSENVLGTTVGDSVASGGAQHVLSGGVTLGTGVAAGGLQTVEAGGVAQGTGVAVGGSLVVS